MGVLLACEKKEKNSSSAPSLSVITLRKCRVDRSFPDHVTRCLVRTGTQAVLAWVAYLNPAF